MDGDLRTIEAEQKGTALTMPAPLLRAPERIAELCRRMMAGRGLSLDLPDLAGCYEHDL